MAVDDRHKRASAQSILLAFIPTTNTDGVAGVDKSERSAVSWMYAGIVVGAPSLAMLPLKSLVPDIDLDLGLTLMPTGNTLSITQVATIPSDAPPGDKGVVFHISGGSLTIYVWDTVTNGWIS